MDKNKNNYIIIYAAVMTILVAVILAVIAVSLAPAHEANELMAKKRDILKSVGEGDVENIDAFFAENIEGHVVNYQGEIIDTVKAIEVNVRESLKIPDKSKQIYPFYVYTTDDGRKNYIIPLEGAGLWGEIWGYLALDEDLNTVVGASFDHKTETPGLGAEIAGAKFQHQFIDKKIYDGDEFVGITVKKGNLDNVEHQVQGISGSTITGDGVTNMIQKDLRNYLPYFDKLKNRS